MLKSVSPHKLSETVAAFDGVMPHPCAVMAILVKDPSGNMYVRSSMSHATALISLNADFEKLGLPTPHETSLIFKGEWRIDHEPTLVIPNSDKRVNAIDLWAAFFAATAPELKINVQYESC